jgi:hypothetical protein
MRRKKDSGQISLFDVSLEPAVTLITPEEQTRNAAALGVPINNSTYPPEERAAFPPLPIEKVLGLVPAEENDEEERTRTAGETLFNGALGPFGNPGGFPYNLPPEVAEKRVWRANNLSAAQSKCRGFELKKYSREPIAPDFNGKPRLYWGWLVPYLLEADDTFLGRWDYWAELCYDGELKPEQGAIPPIKFMSHHEPNVWKMLEGCLNAVTTYGSWEGWSSSSNFEYFLDWLLFSLGHSGQRELPREPMGCEGAALRLYQVFNLAPLLLWPYDYLGEFMAVSGFGKAAGFYPTPHSIVELMTRMLFMGETRDARSLTTMDCCVGTGRMLLYASNYSLRLFGQDINPICVKVSMINGALYAPWLYRPLRFFNDK